MYYPPNFDIKRALELGKLVVQAYHQFEFYKSPAAYVKKYGAPWALPAEYNMVSVIAYNPWQMGFKVDEEDTGPSLIDTEIEEIEKEMEASPDSPNFSLFDREYPMGFVATSKDGKDAYLIFRGTVTPQEFVKDAKILWQPYIFSNWGKVALGFFEVYMACRESFIGNLNNLDAKLNFYISGHSLGGALSVLSLPDVAKSTQFKKPVLYNFGCPRVGDNDFVTAYNTLPGQTTFRIANSSDLVASIPPPAPIYYSHVDVPVEFNIQANDVGKNHSMDETYVPAMGG